MKNSSQNNSEYTRNEKFIDIENVIFSKNPRLLKILPKFAINYLKRILHEDDLNNCINNNKNFNGLDFVEAILKHFKLYIKVYGIENLKNENKILVAANHPLGGIDGMALMYVVASIKPDIVFPVNDFLMNLPNLKSLFIPINKHGLNSKDSIKELNSIFESDKCILFFPAGLASRKINGSIVDLEWKKTFVQKAKQYERIIIPAFISGRNSNFFYNLANFRKLIGIKANIEMLYLVDEMYKQRNKTINIIFGEPINCAPLNKASALFYAKEIKEIVYTLATNTDESSNFKSFDLT